MSRYQIDLTLLALLILWLLTACTQTATTLSPVGYECRAECEPNGKCWAEFNAQDKTGIDESTLGPKELSK